MSRSRQSERAAEERPLTRKEKERLARRQLIVDAAVLVFAQRGFHATKLEEVAERAEFGKATLYSYFETKEALFQAVIEDVFGGLLARAEAAFAASGTFEERLDAYVAAETRSFFEHPEGQYLLIAESQHLRGDNPLLQLGPRHTAILQGAIEKEQRARRLRRDLGAHGLAVALRSTVFAHFLGRIDRIIDEHGLREQLTDDAQFTALNERVKSADIEAEVELARRFVTTLFLDGVRAE